MWKRSQLKFAAKSDLRGFYWLSFAVCLVANILSGGIGGGINYNLGGDSDSLVSNPISPFFIVFVFIVSLIILVFSLAFSVFISNPIIVGKSRFFVHINENDRNFATLFSAFKKGSYISVVKAMFFTYLFIFLWTLLLIIPGIIKSYSYRMAPYILSENPNLHYEEALSISRQMTDGEKLKMFILDLSFIGWFILGFLALIVGILFVLPYYEATWAQFYLNMRNKINPEVQSEEAVQ